MPYIMFLVARFTLLGLTLFSFAVSAQADLRYDVLTVSPTSPGASDGMLDFRLIEGEAPFDIYWNNGIHEPTLYQLEAGMYTAYLIDANSHPFLIKAEVFEPAPFDWTFTLTGQNATILIRPNELEGFVAEAGDYFGVFYEHNNAFHCGGYSRWSGNGAMALAAWGDAPETPETDGFAIDEPYRVAFYDSSSTHAYFLQVDYQLSDLYVDGFYSVNAIHVIERAGNLTGILSVKPDEPVQSTIHLFPNPGTGVFYFDAANFSLQTNLSVYVFTASGRLVYSDRRELGSRPLDLTGFSPGMYWVVLPEWGFKQAVILLNSP